MLEFFNILIDFYFPDIEQVSIVECYMDYVPISNRYTSKKQQKLAAALDFFADTLETIPLKEGV